ncbi:MAG: hypothetical protein AAB431_02945 [Patescibacteria group bacterium]
MQHPQKSLLEEFQHAIRHFAPTLPKEIKKEAQDIHDQLSEDLKADEMQIRKTFYEVGVKEYPYRRAYQELTEGEAGAQMKMLVLEHVDETVRGFIKPHLDAGVSLEELVKSELFETQLTAEQRYQIEDGILVASSKISDELKVQKNPTESTHYDALVKKWTAHAKEIQKAINEYEALAKRGDDNQRREILEKALEYREGFLVTEPDVELEDVKKEIGYWEEIFKEGE